MSTTAPGRLVLIPNTLDLGAAQAVPLPRAPKIRVRRGCTIA
jgi:hypothetical protein